MTIEQILEAIEKHEVGQLDKNFWSTKTHSDSLRAYELIEKRHSGRSGPMVNIAKVFHKEKLLKVIIGDPLFRKQSK